MKTPKFKKKPIYNVLCTTQYGIGCQPVKADNQKEARTKFKKRFKKSSVISISKASSKPLIDAI